MEKFSYCIDYVTAKFVLVHIMFAVYNEGYDINGCRHSCLAQSYFCFRYSLDTLHAVDKILRTVLSFQLLSQFNSTSSTLLYLPKDLLTKCGVSPRVPLFIITYLI